MSDAEAAVIREARRDWVTEHREKYLRSGGVEGHIEDLTPVNGRTYGPNCLIKYKGRKSGKIFITPLSYAAVGGEVVICGSKGGADTHPEWYLNLIASPEIEFQVGTQAFKATWREPEGAEREKVWNILVDTHPFYADYQSWAPRILPLVMMLRGEEIPVFKESDATGMRSY